MFICVRLGLVVAKDHNHSTVEVTNLFLAMDLKPRTTSPESQSGCLMASNASASVALSFH